MAIAKLSTAPVVGLYTTGSAGRGRRGAQVLADLDGVMPLGLSREELTPKVRSAIARLLEENEDLRAELAAARDKMQELGRLADEDSLLPMANRRAFLRELSRMLAFARRYGWSVCLLFFDVDGLKRINDEHGHAAGDACLRHVADLLIANIRGSDLVGRLGGDEIGVIMNRSDLATAREKAASLVAVLECTPLLWQGQVLPLSVSVGVYPYRQGDMAADMLAAADQAMYRAKKAAARR